MTELQNLISDFLKKSRSEAKKPLIVILGPTASGKTALSLGLATHINGEIISADSRQVYRYMDIGTDKIPLQKREGISHHMIDIIDPPERFTVADFKKNAEAKIDDIVARGNVPMVVGGTGLYIDALTKNFSLPPENPALRAQLMNELEELGAHALHEKLRALDPVSAAKIHPHNIPYVVRALEIVMTTGIGKNDARGETPYACLKIGVQWPREELFGRINARVDAQLAAGLLEETQKLLKMGFSKNLHSMSSLGYKEMIAHMEGRLTLSEAVEELKKNTRNFAKRQLTWFKRDSEILWQHAQ